LQFFASPGASLVIPIDDEASQCKRAEGEGNGVLFPHSVQPNAVKFACKVQAEEEKRGHYRPAASPSQIWGRKWVEKIGPHSQLGQPEPACMRSHGSETPLLTLTSENTQQLLAGGALHTGNTFRKKLMTCSLRHLARPH